MSPLHNEILQHSELLRGLASAVSFEEQDGVTRLSESLVPVIDHWSQMEWSILRGEIPWGLSVFGVAVAGEFSYVGVGLPVLSPFIVKVEGATCARGGTDTYILQHLPRATAAATLTAGASAVHRDQRGATVVGTFNLKQLETWTGSDVASTIGSFWESTLGSATNVGIFQSFPHIIKPGGVIVVADQTANTGFTLNMWGRIRRALKSELGPFG